MKSVPASKEKTEDELLDVVESGTHNKIPLGPSERRLKSRYLWISFIIMMFGMAIVGLSFGLLLNKEDTKKTNEESELIARKTQMQLPRRTRQTQLYPHI